MLTAVRLPIPSASRLCQHQTSHLTTEEQTMASERVLDVTMHRHVFDTDRPFARVLDGIFSGISQPDIEQLFSKLAASSTYQSV